MSIVAAVKAYDGIVLGTDSMTQVQGPGGVFKTYPNAEKLFVLEGGCSAAVASYGLGSIANRSIKSYITEFSKAISSKGGFKTVESLTQGLVEFLGKQYNTAFAAAQPDQKPLLGVYVVGYSEDSPLGDELEFQLPRDNKPVIVRPGTEFGASWRGVSAPFTRLYRGIDPRLGEQLLKAGVAEDMLDKLLAPFKSPIIFDSMPLRDAVDFVRFILNTTIETARFEVGLASCGGDLDILAVTREKGVEWVQRKSLF